MNINKYFAFDLAASLLRAADEAEKAGARTT